MVVPSPKEVWNAPQEELCHLLDSGIFFRPKRVQFYAPSFTYYRTASFCNSARDFPTVSVTGNGCALNCKHCGGKVLETMNAAKTPEKLYTLCAKLKQEGALGVLISGGCLPDGSVPLQEFIPAFSRIKKDIGLTVLVHSGIIDSKTAKALKAAGTSAVLIDIIGADETIHDVYNLDITTKHYESSLKALSETGIDFVPHVIVGLHRGELKGEYEALRMIRGYKPSAVVVISFMPIHGTFMEKTKPPRPIDIARTVATARLMFPETPIVLGCMRPKGKHRAEADVLALKAGVDGIAFPAEEAIKYARLTNCKVGFSAFCCAQIYKDLTTN